MTKTYTRKIGQNRGKPRLWLEGAILLDSGFHHGCSWELTKLGDGLLLVAGKRGKRHIAGTPDRPIIDINSGAALAGFQVGEVVVLTVLKKGQLLVTHGEGQP